MTMSHLVPEYQRLGNGTEWFSVHTLGTTPCHAPFWNVRVVGSYVRKAVDCL